ncbi:glycosyltransferase [Pseudobutyrivibrio sp.]|uniref:glycosyltransferase n=1 Tax=Pseudobutyrivibrio sp. TaxID=2014367 RepID=UPI00386DFE7B
MIKVAYILGKLHSGGKKNLVLEYYRHMDTDKIRIDFICDSDSNSIPEEEVRNLGGKVYRVTPYEHIIQNMQEMKTIFENEKYDVIHAWDSMMNLFPLVVAKKAGVKVRISESLSMANKGEAKTYIKYALRPFSSIGANYFMACGVDCGVFQFGKSAYEKGKIAIFKTVINTEANTYDPELRTTTRKKFGWEEKHVYGFIGRYMPQKNPVFIIDIFNEIKKIDPKAHLVLIGFGGLEQAMMDKVTEYNITDKVQNLGRREDIKQFYNAFDCFLLPSLYEGLPVVGLESQSCGLPIFFSTEITQEAKACEMAHYISLKTPAKEWAKQIVNVVEQNILVRRNYSKEVAKAGFDSKSEALRLQVYYMNAIEENKK